METKDIQKLQEEYGQTTDTISQRIAKEAEKICNTRKEKAEAVEKCVNLIEIKKQESDNATIAIKDKLQYIDCESETKEKIGRQCNAIEELWKDYHQEASKLAARFKHEKIKIVSYGTPGQGKSSFVHLLTDLPNNVVAVHPDNDSRDKTGALNVIHYDSNLKNDEYKIHVCFKSENEFLQQFVNALKGLEITHFCNIDIDSLSISSIKESIGKECDFKHKNGEVYRANVKNEDGTESYTLLGDSGLVNFIIRTLDRRADLKNLSNTKGRDISPDEISIYNDIQNEGPRCWMTVEKIDIYAKFGFGNMFTYFDICDTKGIGDNVGGTLAEFETFSELANCDAAFSIAQVSGNNTRISDFYNEKIRKFCISTPSFIHRNFIISNKYNGTTQASVDDFIRNINTQNVAVKCYDGELKDGKNPKVEATPKLFVNLIMLDMLGSIVKVVENEDDRLMENCNRFAKDIKSSVAELGDLLQSFKVENVDIDDILIKKIKDISLEADKEMLNQFFKGQQPDEQPIISAANQNKPKGDGFRDDGRQQNNNRNTYTSDSVEYSETKYKSIIKDNKEALSVYQLLTGVEEDGNYRQMGVNEAIESAVEYLMKDAKESVDEKAKGNSNDIGRYIDAISDYYRKTFQERAGQHVPQSVINTKEIKDKIISVAWKKMYLDKLLGDFDKSVLEKYKYNLRIGQLLSAYNKDAWDSGEEPFRWILSYDVLQAYFSLNPKRNGVSYLECTIDESILKKAVAKCLNSKGNNFIKFLIDRGVNIRERIQYTVYRYTYENLLDLESQPYDLLPLYKNNVAECVKVGILPADYEKRINQSDAKSDMDSKFVQLSHLIVPLVQ